MDQHRHRQLLEDRGVHRHAAAIRDAEREGRRQIGAGVRQRPFGGGGPGWPAPRRLPGASASAVAGSATALSEAGCSVATSSPWPHRPRLQRHRGDFRHWLRRRRFAAAASVASRRGRHRRPSACGCRRQRLVHRLNWRRRHRPCGERLGRLGDCGSARLAAVAAVASSASTASAVAASGASSLAAMRRLGLRRRLVVVAAQRGLTRAFVGGDAALFLQPVADLAKRDALAGRQALLAVRRAVLGKADDLVGKAPLLLRHDRQDRHFALERVFGRCGLAARLGCPAHRARQLRLDGGASSAGLAFTRARPVASGSTTASPARATPKPRKPLKLRARS